MLPFSPFFIYALPIFTILAVAVLGTTRRIGFWPALILSIVWPLLVLGCFLPAVAAWAVAFIPLHDWVGEETLRIVWIALAVAIPMIVGGLTAWIVPSRKQRGSVLRTIFSGYPLTLGMFLSFLITFLVVILVLYLVNLLPIDGRAKQIVRAIVIIIGIISILKYLAVF